MKSTKQFIFNLRCIRLKILQSRLGKSAIFVFVLKNSGFTSILNERKAINLHNGSKTAKPCPRGFKD